METYSRIRMALRSLKANPGVGVATVMGKIGSGRSTIAYILASEISGSGHDKVCIIGKKLNTNMINTIINHDNLMLIDSPMDFDDMYLRKVIESFKPKVIVIDDVPLKEYRCLTGIVISNNLSIIVVPGTDSIRSINTHLMLTSNSVIYASKYNDLYTLKCVKLRYSSYISLPVIVNDELPVELEI